MPNFLYPAPMALLAAAMLAPAAAADEKPAYPAVSGAVAIEVQNDWATDSEDPAAEFNTLFTKIEPSLSVAFTKELSANMQLTFEPVQAPTVGGEDQFFDNQGLYVEVLTLNYDAQRFSLYGGKFAPNFGIAHQAAPGIYGTDIAEEYEKAERIGFGGSFTMPTGGLKIGAHTVSASTFFLDTSGLAESAFTRRTKSRQGDGGASNTGDLSSYAVGLDGGDFPGAPGLRYHLGYIHERQGAGNTADQHSVAVAAEYAIPVSQEVTITPLIEFVRETGSEATANQDRTYLTGALAVAYGNWNLALAATDRHTDAADGTDETNTRFQVSAGYAFDNGVGVNLGWMRDRTGGTRTDTFGALLTYEIEF